MLPHYSPLKVAETFKCSMRFIRDASTWVSAGRPAAPRWKATRCGATAISSEIDDFPQQLGELRAFLEHSSPPSIPSTGSGSRPTCRAPRGVAAGFQYVECFSRGPTRVCPTPSPTSSTSIRPGWRWSTTANISNAPTTLAQPQRDPGAGSDLRATEEEALRLLSSARLFRNRIRRGEVGPIPTAEEALAELGPSPRASDGRRTPNGPAISPATLNKSAPNSSIWPASCRSRS